MIPHAKSLLEMSIRFHRIAVISADKSSPKRCLRDYFLVISLAAAIHGTDKAVRLAAYRMLCEAPIKYQAVLVLIVSSSEPLNLMGRILEGLEGDKPKRKRGGKNWNRTAKRAGS
jgi:hypothetical protein